MTRMRNTQRFSLDLKPNEQKMLDELVQRLDAASRSEAARKSHVLALHLLRLRDEGFDLVGTKEGQKTVRLVVL